METHVWWGTTFSSSLFIGFIPSSYHSLFLFILPSYVRGSKKIGVCEVGEKDCTYVKMIYNGFWLELVSHFSFVFSFDFLNASNSF
jgi:hypothetical protein